MLWLKRASVLAGDVEEDNILCHHLIRARTSRTQRRVKNLCRLRYKRVPATNSGYILIYILPRYPLTDLLWVVMTF